VARLKEFGPGLVHAFHWQSGEVGGHGRKARQHGMVDGGEFGRIGTSADFAALVLVAPSRPSASKELRTKSA
jgi:hypothetical protein